MSKYCIGRASVISGPDDHYRPFRPDLLRGVCVSVSPCPYTTLSLLWEHSINLTTK